MRRSSVRERRCQTEPFAALAAVFVVALALGVYAGAFEAAFPAGDERSVASPTVDRVERALSAGGVLDPDGLASARRVAPDGYRTNVTLRYAGRTVTAGPTPPPTADAASRRVSVRVGPGDVRPGRLEVAVWT